MGKRKPTSPDISTPPPPSAPSDGLPCSSGMDLLPKEMPSHAVDDGTVKPVSSATDAMDQSENLQDTQPSLSNQNFNLGRSMLLKRSRHYYGQQYSRRNSANHAHGSTSHRKNTPLRDEKLILKLSSQCKPEYGRSEEMRQRTFCPPERIRSGPFITEAITDVAKMACGICQKVFRRKQYPLEDGSSSTDVSVVAVLACGHVYHADCLEQRTCHEARRDPPCPLCVGSLSDADGS